MHFQALPTLSMRAMCSPLKETGAGRRGGRGWGSGSILGARAQRTIFGRRGHTLETVKAFTRCELLSQLTDDLQVILPLRASFCPRLMRATRHTDRHRVGGLERGW